jgi:hypothetical protein
MRIPARRATIYDRAMEIVEVRPGLHRWEQLHPEWVPKDAERGGWEEVVASYAVEADDGLVLIDPLAPPGGTSDAGAFWAWVDDRTQRLGAPAVLLTIFWHARSSQAFLDRYPDGSVWAYQAARELVSERTQVTDGFRPGDELPGGAVAYHAGRALEVALWMPSHGALVAGDVLLGDDEAGARLCPQRWLGDGRSYADVREAFAPMLELPIELLLLTHGEAIADDARGTLERALAAE